MLRIDTNQDTSPLTSGPVVLHLSGQLVAATLPSLKLLLESARASGWEVDLDMDGVARIDRVASEYLAHAISAGTRLLRCPLSVRVWPRARGAAGENDRESAEKGEKV